MTNRPPISGYTVRKYETRDYPHIIELYKTTQRTLVIPTCKKILKSPVTWLIWILSCLTLGTLTGLPLGLVLIFLLAQVTIQDQIDEALANDLRDPSLTYYSQHLSQFWVLTRNDDQVYGMIGLSCHLENIEDQRQTVPYFWQQCVRVILGWFNVRLELKGWKACRNEYDDQHRVFAYRQIPKTATVTRWSVRLDYQGLGLSTLLLDQAMTWAHDHDINRLYGLAFSQKAESILLKHGFTMMKHFKLGYFGEYSRLFGCRVKAWIEKNEKKKD